MRLIHLCILLCTLFSAPKLGYSQARDFEPCSVTFPSQNIDWGASNDQLAVGFGSSLFVFDQHLDLVQTLEGSPISDSDSAYHSEWISVQWRPNTSTITAISASSRGLKWDTLEETSETWLNSDMTARSMDWHPDGELISLAAMRPDYPVALTYEFDGNFFARTDVFSQNMGNTILFVAWNPNGQVLAMGEANGILSFWDIAAKSHINSFTLSDSDVTSLQWNADGTNIAVGFDSGAVGVWNFDEGNWIEMMPSSEELFVTGLAWHTQQPYLATALSNGQVYIQNTTTMELLGELSTSPSNTVSLAWRDSTLAIFSCSGIIDLWDTDTYEKISEAVLD